MPVATPFDGAAVRVLTFKDGFLSGVAHDLELALDRFRIEWDLRHVSATFDTRSLRVLHAVVSGRPARDTLSARDRRKIEQTIAADVLLTTRHPEARFESDSVEVEGDGFVVRGTFTLAGGRQEVSAHVRREGARYTSELVLDQRGFGITPYSAMLGTLKLKPEVRVHISVPV